MTLVRTPAPPRPRYPLRRTDVEPGGAQLWNWAQNSVIGAASAVVAPASEAELAALLARTTSPVRVVGSRMSPGRLTELAGAGAVALDLRHLRGLLATSGGADTGDTADASDGGSTATFAAGTPLEEVYAALAQRGLELPSSPGVIAHQTLGGALATGTHGQGLGQSSIADAATRVRLLLADGSALEVTPDHPWWGAVQLGLGALGVVTAVTLRTRPTTVYTCVKTAVGAERLADDLAAWNAAHAVTKAWWFPDEAKVHLWAADEASGEQLRAYREGGSALLEHDGRSDAMNAAVDAALATMRDDTRIVDADGKPFRTVTRFKDFTDVTGDVYQVFMRGIATPQINVEVGVPLERAGEVVRALQRWHTSTRPHMHYPVILRCTGASSAWLSPAREEATCYVGLVVYYAADGSLSGAGEDFLHAAEELLAGLGGRPHWGKYFDADLYDWPALYPRWHDFRAVREALDPGHRFSNAFTAALLGA